MMQKTETIYNIEQTQHQLVSRLSSREKALLRYAVIEKGDKVLYVNCGSSALLNALALKEVCQMCGTSSDFDNACKTRIELPAADIVYVQKNEIPWHDDTFDIILISSSDHHNQTELMDNVIKKLKPGGQLLMYTPWQPRPFIKLASFFSKYDKVDGKHTFCTKQIAVTKFEKYGLQNISFHLVKIGTAITVGWKRKYD